MRTLAALMVSMTLLTTALFAHALTTEQRPVSQPAQSAPIRNR
jgi:hypothetical protein